MNGMAAMIVGTITLSLALVVSSCGAPGGSAAGTTSPTNTPASTDTLSPQQTNPVEEADAAALAQAGLPLEAPFGSEDVSYSLIDGKTAQVRFTLNGVDYTFRGTREEGDVAGVYGEIQSEETIAACGGVYSQTTTYRTYTDGGKVALWDSAGVHCSLYAAAPDESFSGMPDGLGRYVAARLDPETWPVWEADPFDESGDAALTVQAADSDGITVDLENHLPTSLTYGEDYTLVKKVGNAWRRVPCIQPETSSSGAGFNSIGYELEGNSAKELNIDWRWLYGELENGEYRFIKGVSWVKSDEDFRNAGLYADFTVTHSTL